MLYSWLDQACRQITGPDSLRAHLRKELKEHLEEAIDAHDIDAPRPIREETLWEYFHKRDVEWWSKGNDLLKPVLIFDQFEEIITTGQKNRKHSQRCSQFLEELEDLIENRPPVKLLERFSAEKGLAKNYDLDRLDYRVVISLREDYLADLESLRERLRPIMVNRYRLYPLNEEQGLEVILQPGKHLVDQEEAQQIIDFVTSQTEISMITGDETITNRLVEPSLLCVIMRELNNKRNTTEIDAKNLSTQVQNLNMTEKLRDNIRPEESKGLRCVSAPHESCRMPIPKTLRVPTHLGPTRS